MVIDYTERNREVLSFNQIIHAVNDYLSTHERGFNKEEIHKIVFEHHHKIEPSRVAVLASIFNIDFSKYALESPIFDPGTVNSSIRKTFQAGSTMFLGNYVEPILTEEEKIFSQAFGQIISVEQDFRRRELKPSSFWVYLTGKYGDSPVSQT